MPTIELAPGAEDNGLAMMLADLVRQNLEAKPHKNGDFDALDGSVSIVADDADVALTLRFDSGKLTIHAGQHTLTAEDPLPPGLRDAPALIK